MSLAVAHGNFWRDFEKNKKFNGLISTMQKHGAIVEAPFVFTKWGVMELRMAHEENTLHLAYIGVPEDEKRKGLGTNQMNYLILQCKEIGLNIELTINDTWTEKKLLQKFYSKFGFKKDGKKLKLKIGESDGK